MIFPDRAQFHALASGQSAHIPMRCEALADLDTPLSAYIKLARGHPYSYLFESVQGNETWGRYSIIGLPAKRVYRFHGDILQVLDAGEITEERWLPDPLAEVAALWRRHRALEIPNMPRFTGGLVGYFGYDTVHHIEPRVPKNAQDTTLKTPDILLMLSEEVLVFDTLCGLLHIIVHVDPREKQAWQTGTRRLHALREALQQTRISRVPMPETPTGTQQECDFQSNFSRDEFEAAVHRCKEYIHDGDIMQVVLSQRFSLPFRAEALDLYRALRRLNPSPYMYYLHMDDFHIVGSSPEILARLEEDTITVRPIAGTRRRGQDSQQDRALEHELLRDAKELAEHIMLIDLGRNDVARVAVAGTVQLTERMNVERYSHVMHMVSKITGRISGDQGAMDVLRATFPAGTVSGAPKIRAMEIISEMEPVRRGVYAGAIGYLDWRGGMDTAIAIRTAIIRDDILYVQAGAGIVADSNPAHEWTETVNKGRALFRAAAMVTGKTRAEPQDKTCC